MRASAQHAVPRIVVFTVGAACGGIVVGLWALLYQVSLTPYPPFDLADLVIRYAPGDLATWAIETFGHLAQRLIQASCIALWIAAWGVLALLVASSAGYTGVRVAAVSCGLLASALWLAWWSAGGFSLARASGIALAFALIIGGVGIALVRWLSALQRVQAEIASAGEDVPWHARPATYQRRDILRRAFVLTLSLGVGGTLLGRLLARAVGDAEVTSAGVALETLATPGASATANVAAPTLPTAVPAVPLPDTFSVPHGVRTRLTPNDQFYRVDISTRAPGLAETDWTLKIHGLVDHELRLTRPEFLELPAIEQYATLMCISFTYGSDLISTTRWTGVRLRDVLQRAGVQDGVVDLICRGAGGYSDSIPLAKALESSTLLAYGMNGYALPQKHGFPCRLYVAGLYGEKNVKWLEEIELVNYDYHGFWQERGWTDKAVIQTVSVIDTPGRDAAVDATGSIPVAGIAFAGSRGISSVEVQVDDGDWVPAEVEPYDPVLVWQRWKMNWHATPGKHTLRVRATDGDGVLQIGQHADPHPDGMTGYHAVQVQVS